MKWFRLYSSVLHDPKVQKLHPATFRHWINILCVVSENEPRGVLPATESVAYALQVRPFEAEIIIGKLLEKGLLERGDGDKIIAHNWSSRQRVSDTSNERVRRHRAETTPQSLQTPGDIPAISRQDENIKPSDNSELLEDVTLQKRSVDTDTDTDTEEEIKKERKPSPSVLLNLWNKIVKIPRATAMTKTREIKSRLRLNERTPEEWQLIMEKIPASDFLSGSNDKGWRADYDWLVSNDTNAVKILEGRYDNKQKGGISNDFTKRFLEGDSKDNGGFASV